jgi:hypothetical protein
MEGRPKSTPPIPANVATEVATMPVIIVRERFRQARHQIDESATPIPRATVPQFQLHAGLRAATKKGRKYEWRLRRAGATPRSVSMGSLPEFALGIVLVAVVLALILLAAIAFALVVLAAVSLSVIGHRVRSSRRRG